MTSLVKSTTKIATPMGLMARASQGFRQVRKFRVFAFRAYGATSSEQEVIH